MTENTTDENPLNYYLQKHLALKTRVKVIRYQLFMFI